MPPPHRSAAQGGISPRLARLGRCTLPGGGRVFVARTFRQRLAGLMLLRGLPAGTGLLIEGADSIHTAWMRFPIDVAFLDRDGRPLELVSAVVPWRIVSHRGAAAVVEANAGEGSALVGVPAAVREPARPP